MKAINRRQAFTLGGGFVMLTMLPMAADAEVTNDAAKWIEKFTGGKQPVKVIVVPNKLVNVVVR